MTLGRCSSILSIAPTSWRVLLRPRSDPSPGRYHLRSQQQHFHWVARYCCGDESSQAGDLHWLSSNEHIKVSWDDTPGVLETAHEPIVDKPLGIEDANVIEEKQLSDGIDASERRRLRLRAAAAWSQIHKEHKGKKRNEHAAVKSMYVDWYPLLSFLKRETRAECVDQHQDVVFFAGFESDAQDQHQDVVRYTGFNSDAQDQYQDVVRYTSFNSHARLVTELRGDQIARPDEWNMISFAHYVQSLVYSHVSPLRHRELYQYPESHSKVVADVLDRLFQDNSLYPYWSVGACNDALVFFYKYWMLHRVRALYSHMETRRFITSTDTINIMLYAAAKAKSLSEVQGLLRLMMKKNLKPNVHTWQAFFLVSFDRGRYEVFRAMQERGLLAKFQSISNFFTLNIRKILCAVLNRGHSITWFLEFMDKFDHFDWLSTKVGNIIVHEVGKRGLPEDALSIFNDLIMRGLKPNETTLNTLLHRCLPDRAHDLTIQALRKLSNHSIAPQSDAYEALFTQFWRSRHYSCARVIWRYACVQGQTSYKMRWLVGRNLHAEPKSDPSGQPPGRSEVWHHCAGKVILGATNPSPPGSDGTDPTTPEETTNTAWSALFEQDLATAHRYEPTRSLTSLLDEALATDRMWAQNRIWRDKPLSWIQEHAIAVPLRQSDAARVLPLLPPPKPFERRLLMQEDSEDEGAESSMYRLMRVEGSTEFNDFKLFGYNQFEGGDPKEKEIPVACKSETIIKPTVNK